MENKEVIRIGKIMIDLINHEISIRDAIHAVEEMEEWKKKH